MKEDVSFGQWRPIVAWSGSRKIRPGANVDERRDLESFCGRRQSSPWIDRLGESLSQRFTDAHHRQEANSQKSKPPSVQGRALGQPARVGDRRIARNRSVSLAAGAARLCVWRFTIAINREAAAQKSGKPPGKRDTRDLMPDVLDP